MIKRHSQSSAALQDWWRKLQPNSATGYRGDRAAIAQLRHASNVMAASMQPASIALCRALGAPPAEMSHVGFMAATLADLRQDEPSQTIARALGSPEEARLCAPLRFRRLLDATELDGQLTALRRALALLKHRGSAEDLINSLLDWNDPARRDERRQRWLYDYYQTNNPQISANPELT